MRPSAAEENVVHCPSRAPDSKLSESRTFSVAPSSVPSTAALPGKADDWDELTDALNVRNAGSRFCAVARVLFDAPSWLSLSTAAFRIIRAVYPPVVPPAPRTVTV